MQNKIFTPGLNDYLVESLSRHKVKFIIVGGAAIRFHYPDRVTYDLDILIEPTKQNAEAVELALSSDPQFPITASIVERLSQPKKIQVPIKHFSIDVDILIPANDFDFDLHWIRSKDSQIGKTPVKVASIDSLVELLTDSNEKKHLDDISLLKSLSGYQSDFLNQKEDSL